jgi:hypothetical protein
MRRNEKKKAIEVGELLFKLKKIKPTKETVEEYFHTFIHPFRKCILSVYYIQVGSKDIAVNRIVKIFALYHGTYTIVDNV